MANQYQVVFIGGGNAGLSAMNYLMRQKKGLKIALVEPSDKHYYQPAWTLVGGGAFDINDTVRAEADYIPKGVDWIKEKCVSFQPENNQITLASGQTLSYDYLVVAPGIQLDWHKIQGLQGNLGKNGICSNYSFETAPYTFECIQNLQGGKALFHNPNTPVKCGGAPHKIMYLASDYWRKQGLLKQTDIHYYSGIGAIFAVKKYADTLNQVIQRYGINTHFMHNLVAIDAERKQATFDVYKDGSIVDRIVDNYDMIHVTPPQSAPDFIKNSPLAIPNNPFGWIDVDKFTLQHNTYKNIFSCGDASGLPTSKTGAAIRKQVPAMIKNLIALMETGQVGSAQYSGYTSCPLVTGYGKLVLAEFDYNNQPMETFPFDQSKERYSMYFLKKQILPRLYFGQILHGRSQG